MCYDEMEDEWSLYKNPMQEYHVFYLNNYRNVEDAMDLRVCEEMYSLDMEKIRSLLSSMYGVNIEVSTMLNNDEEE